MSAAILNFEPVYKNDTWDGFTVALSSDGTAFAGTLTLVRVAFTNSSGTIALTLSSANSGEITINSATPNSWNFTVEPQVLTLTGDIYSYGVELTDDAGIVKTRLAGIIQIKNDPV